MLLLKALVAIKEGEARAEQIEDVLWPDADGDVARRAFETTLHRLRKWMGHADALRFSNGLVEAEALQVYARCQRTLAAVLGVKPSPRTMAVYRSLR